jgi:hypothetical protein
MPTQFLGHSLFHRAEELGGKFTATEIWENREANERFLQQRLFPATSEAIRQRVERRRPGPGLRAPGVQLRAAPASSEVRRGPRGQRIRSGPLTKPMAKPDMCHERKKATMSGRRILAPVIVGSGLALIAAGCGSNGTQSAAATTKHRQVGPPWPPGSQGRRLRPSPLL